MFKRVVVTGMGMISPLGNKNETFINLINNKSGIIKLNEIKNKSVKLRNQYGDNIYIGNVKEDMENKLQIINNRTNQFVEKSVEDCLLDSKMIEEKNQKEIIKNVNLNRIGVDIGVMSSNISSIQSNIEQIVGLNMDYGKINRLNMLQILNNMISSYISIKYKLGGVNVSTSSACGTGLSSIINGCRIIQMGQQDVMIVGAGEESINDVVINSAIKLKAMNTKHYSNPSQSSRPFDENRSGFVLGEGAGILQLEELQHALKRNSQIYCEIKGYGQSSDCFNLSQPSPKGEKVLEAMMMAVRGEKGEIKRVDCVDAHATSTPLGDQAELLAIEGFVRQINQPVMVTANKGNLGHCFSAAGVIETIIAITSIQQSILPAIPNLQSPIPLQQQALVQLLTQNHYGPVNSILKNSFGFGGSNNSILITKYIE